MYVHVSMFSIYYAFVVGHDTTASGISWVLYCLAKHSDIQEKVYKEINDTIGDDAIQW